MGDVFKEQLVKREPTAMERLKRFGLITAAAVLSLLSLAIPAVAPVIIMFIGAGTYYLLSFLKKEYEYIFTNGTLDIDVIYNKSRRRQVFTGEVKEFTIMAPVGDRSRFGTGVAELDYSSGVPKPNTFAFLTTYKGKKVKIIIEPNETMLQAFATVLPPRKFERNISKSQVESL